MSGQEIFRRIYDQVLDYADEELIERCSKWGYGIVEQLFDYNKFVSQPGTDASTAFIYAVTTAVIMGEFGQLASKDFFSRERGIDLDLLGMDFSEVSSFLDKDVSTDRKEFLEGGNTIGLQDVWETINGWKSDIYDSLSYIYNRQNKNPDEIVFKALAEVLGINIGTEDVRLLPAYSYVSSGFQK